MNCLTSSFLLSVHSGIRDELHLSSYKLSMQIEYVKDVSSGAVFDVEGVGNGVV